MRNGLNIAAVSEMVHEIKTVPREAQARLHARVELLAPQIGQVKIGTLVGGSIRVARDFGFLTTPASVRVASAPTQLEHLLVALGGCVLVTFVQGCSARGFTLMNATVQVSATLGTDSAGAPIIDDVRYHYDIDSDAPPDVLVEIARYVSCLSPNHRTLLERAPIVVSWDGEKKPVDCVVERVSAGRREPNAAAATLGVEVAWRYGTQLAARVTHDHSVLVDQPKQFLGLDSAPNPQEYFLAALGADLAHELRRELQRRDLWTGDLEVAAAGSLDLRGITNVDDSAPVRMHDVAVKVTGGSSAGAAELEQVVGAAAARCIGCAAICEEHPIDVSVAARSELIASFRSDAAMLSSYLLELAQRKKEAAIAAAKSS